MKKILSIFILFIMINTVFTITAEEQPDGIPIAETIRSFMLSNNPVQSAEITKIVRGDPFFTAYTLEHEIKNVTNQTGLIGEEAEEKAKTIYEYTMADLISRFGGVPENSFCYYPLITINYAKQYADNYKFDALISNDKIWAVTSEAIAHKRNYYDKDFSNAVIRSTTFDKETIAFLQNPEAIEQMVKQEVNEVIVDCKIVFLELSTILYLKGINNDYCIKLHDDIVNQLDNERLECFKIFSLSKILESCAYYKILPYPQVLIEKPTYEAEATALQAEGLIQGNENGLDLLKPLSRIEATTILVRALGYENEPTETASQFTDIPNDNWAVKYANIAKAKGLSNGIGDNKFAPDERVTSDQFATLLLRNFEADDFDWQTATQMLIDKNIITTEQADTMDLFTRGDMAKIIYEAKQKGLLN